MIRIASVAVGLVAVWVAVQPARAQDGWGNIKGRVVWGGEKLPAMPELAVTGQDMQHCLSKGPILDEKYVVDPKTKGMKNIFAYLRGKQTKIHPDYPQTAEDVRKQFDTQFAALNNGIKPEDLEKAIADGKLTVKGSKAPVILDQVFCRYVPHALAVRVGQRVLAKNPEPFAHNVNVSGIEVKNGSNNNMPGNTVTWLDWIADNYPLTIKCGQHSWMQMNAMVFDHPYFAVTGDDGTFELKNVPAGEVSLILRNPVFIDALKGGKGKGTGAKLTVKPGETLDLGEIKFSGD